MRFNDSLVIRYNITLTGNKEGSANAIFEQIYTGLNDKGNKFIESYSDELYIEEIIALGKMLNHYLKTGKS